MMYCGPEAFSYKINLLTSLDLSKTTFLHKCIYFRLRHSFDLGKTCDKNNVNLH